MESIWKEAVKVQETEEERESKRLTGTRHTQVAVIGAGMAGILTAYMLQQNWLIGRHRIVSRWIRFPILVICPIRFRIGMWRPVLENGG